MARSAIRLGFRQIDGFRKEWAERLVAARGAGFTHVEQLASAPDCRRGRCGCWPMPMPAARSGSAGARRCGRRGGLRRACCRCSPHAEAAELGEEADAQLPAMPLPEEVVTDYQVTRLSLKGHPMQFLRATFEREGRAELRRGGEGAQRQDRAGRRGGADPPAAGQGQCAVHHAGGRDRHHQCAAVGARFRTLSPRGDGRPADGGRRRDPAQQGRGDAFDRPARVRPQRAARAADRRPPLAADVTADGQKPARSAPRPSAQCPRSLAASRADFRGY